MKTTKMLSILILVTVLIGAVYDDLPDGWYEVDIGEVSQAGSAFYDNETDTWIVTGGGNDSIHYVYNPLNGDGSIIAKVAYAHLSDYAQLTIREQLSYDSKHATISLYGGLSRSMFPDGPQSDPYRAVFSYVSEVDSGSSSEGLHTMPCWLILVRKGDEFSCYIQVEPSEPEEPLWGRKLVGSATIQMGTNVFIGFAVESSGTFQFETVDIEGNTDVELSGPDEDWWISGNNMYSIPTGNVGIGTTSPDTKLEVQGGPIKATGGLIIETRTDDPPNPVTGQIWLRTDL